MNSIVPSLIVALKHLIKADEVNCDHVKHIAGFPSTSQVYLKVMNKPGLLT